MEQKKKHSHQGHRQRVKTKALEGGIEHWPYHEILELLLMYSLPYKDVNPLAHELIDYFGTLGGVLDAGYEQLNKIKGVGHETALFLSLLPDIFTKYTASKNVDTITLENTIQTVNYFRSIDRIRDTEAFYILCLNNRKKLIKTIKVKGDLPSQIDISLSEFGSQILFKGNSSIVIMHSHPNGIADPTQSDISATGALIKAAGSVGIKVEDHIIVTRNSFYSFHDNKLLEGLIEEAKAMGYIKIREDD